MVPLVALAGLPVAALAGAVVYADAASRDVPSSTRRRWTGGVVAASLAGFLVAAVLDATPFRAYAALSGDPVVVATPLQFVSTLVGVGLAVTVAAVLAYAIGSRSGPVSPADRTT